MTSLLREGKEVYRLGKRPELRNDRARVHAVLHGKEHATIVKKQTATAGRKLSARKKKFETKV